MFLYLSLWIINLQCLFSPFFSNILLRGSVFMHPANAVLFCVNFCIFVFYLCLCAVSINKGFTYITKHLLASFEIFINWLTAEALRVKPVSKLLIISLILLNSFGNFASSHKNLTVKKNTYRIYLLFKIHQMTHYHFCKPDTCLTIVR